MGYSGYSADIYAHKAAVRSASATPVFAYTSSINTGAASAKTHDDLNPVVFGKKNIYRESRDSKEHPNSNAIVVAFDVTGSMGEVPGIVQKKLNSLMALILKNSYIDDPQILCSAFGDGYTDNGPIQVGQFESGNEVEDHLTNFWLEGGGGGQTSESPGLLMYYLANYTKMDCLEKRNKKGYLFIITDEKSHPVPKDQIKEFLGVTAEKDYSFEEVLKMTQEKFNVFVITPNLTSHYNNPQVNNFWKGLVGENYIKLDDPNGVAELIGSTIGLCEGNVDSDVLVNDLIDVGLSNTSIDAITKSLSNIKNSSGLSKKFDGTGLKPL